MCKSNFVIFLKHLLVRDPIIIQKKDGNISVYNNLYCVQKFDNAICYGLSSVIENFRAINILPPTVIDISLAKKILIGTPKDELMGSSLPWDINGILTNQINPLALKYLKNYTNNETATELSPEIHDEIINGFEKAWHVIEKELEQNHEKKRFYEIENPLYNIFIKAQYYGIMISQQELQARLNALNEDYYSHLKNLEINYGFRSQQIKANMSWQDIAKYCSINSDIASNNADFWQTAEIYEGYNDFIDSLICAHKAKIDYDALLRYAIDRYYKIYPQYDIMGTVTGRIIIESPGIQYLRKKNRTIFLPRPEKVFLYADFDQFEPGIIASFSKDAELISLYNNGDIYEELSFVIFGQKDKKHRKSAKIFFLSYIYGMNIEKIISIIESHIKKSVRMQVLAFFDRFYKLCEWKEEVCKEARKNGFAASILGNRRYLKKQGEMSEKEKRWVPSQIIQGTASYIFKKSLLRLSLEYPSCNLLIPMHDAILVEINKNEESPAKEIIQYIFCDEFKQVCCEINPAVSFESFCDK